MVKLETTDSCDSRIDVNSRFLGFYCLIFFLCFGVGVPLTFMFQDPKFIFWGIFSSQIIAMSALLVKFWLQPGYKLLFSSSFWLGVNLLLYFIIRSFYIPSEEYKLYRELNVYILFFVLVFVFFNTVSLNSRVELLARRTIKFIPTGGRLAKFLGIFVLIKLFLLVLSRVFVSGTDVLSVAADTQNQGMSYLFNIDQIATFIYYFMLWVAYSKKKWIWPVLILSSYLLFEYFTGAARMKIILMVFINLYFLDKFVFRVRLVWLVLAAPVVIFIVSFFGYVRNVEIGSGAVYSDAFQMLTSNFSLVFELFVARLDLLPSMLNAYALYVNDGLPNLYGKSYIYMFLHAVPRSIWESKPPLSCALITSIIEPSAFADGVNLYCSIIIEALINFGTISVLIAGAVLGIIGRWLDLFKDGSNAYGIMLYLIFFTYPMGLFNEGFHSNYLAYELYTIFLAILTYFMTSIVVVSHDSR